MSRLSKARFRDPFPSPGAKGLASQQRKAFPHEFVLDAISSLAPRTRSMFGCLAVYVEEKIVLILRDKKEHSEDNGVWLATTAEHHESLRVEFPNLRSIRVLGKGVTGWQVMPADDANFEDDALRVCDLIVAGDPRIGKLPGTRRSSRRRAGKHRQASARAKKTKKMGKERTRK